MTTFTVEAILFDMDGTLVSSTAAVEAAWGTFVKTYPHLDLPTILKSSHGVRTIDNFRRFLPPQSEEELEAESQRFEEEIMIQAAERAERGEEGLVLLPGVTDIMKSLEVTPPTAQRWAISTSATRVYGTQALRLSGIKQPDIFVVADDVTRGKPFPEPYLMTAEKLNVDPAKCVVIEDAPAGVTSGKAAGCKVIAVCTSHSRERMAQTEADWLIEDLTKMTAERLHDNSGIRITIGEHYPLRLS